MCIFFYLLFLCTRQETLSLGNLRARAFEAQRWVKVQLDSLGAVPDEDSDRDLEAGWASCSPVLVSYLWPSSFFLVRRLFFACFLFWKSDVHAAPMYRCIVICMLIYSRRYCGGFQATCLRLKSYGSSRTAVALLLPCSSFLRKRKLAFRVQWTKSRVSIPLH